MLARAPLSVAESVASSAVKTALDLKAALIVVCTETGNTARLVAKYCPNVRTAACGWGCVCVIPIVALTDGAPPCLQIPIVALTAEDYVARQVAGVMKGVRARLEGSMVGTSRLLNIAALSAKEQGLAKAGDFIVAVHGAIDARPGSTNMCKVITVE